MASAVVRSGCPTGRGIRSTTPAVQSRQYVDQSATERCQYGIASRSVLVQAVSSASTSNHGYCWEHSAQGRNSDLWMNEGNIRWRVRDDVTLAAGREVLLWGPAQFWNPSNPFYHRQRARQCQARGARQDLCPCPLAALADGWNLHAISRSTMATSKTGVERMDAVKLDWVGSGAGAAARWSRCRTGKIAAVARLGAMDGR